MDIQKILALLDDHTGSSDPSLTKLYSPLNSSEDRVLSSLARKLLLRLASDPSAFYDIPYSLAQELLGAIEQALEGVSSLMVGDHGILRWTAAAGTETADPEQLEALLRQLRGMERNQLTETVVVGAEKRIQELQTALAAYEAAGAPGKIQLPTNEEINLLRGMLHNCFFLVERFLSLQSEVESAEIALTAKADSLGLLDKYLSLLRDDDGEQVQPEGEARTRLMERLAAVQAFLEHLRNQPPMFGSLLSPDVVLQRDPLYRAQVTLDEDTLSPQAYFSDVVCTASDQEGEVLLTQTISASPIFLGRTFPVLPHSSTVPTEIWPAKRFEGHPLINPQVFPSGPPSIHLPGYALVATGRPGVGEYWYNPTGDPGEWAPTGEEGYYPTGFTTTNQNAPSGAVIVVDGTDVTHWFDGRWERLTLVSSIPATYGRTFENLRENDPANGGVASAFTAMPHYHPGSPTPTTIDSQVHSVHLFASGTTTTRVRVGHEQAVGARWLGKRVTLQYQSGPTYACSIISHRTVGAAEELELDIQVPRPTSSTSITVYDGAVSDGIWTRALHVQGDLVPRIGDTIVYGGVPHTVAFVNAPLVILEEPFVVQRTALNPRQPSGEVTRDVVWGGVVGRVGHYGSLREGDKLRVFSDTQAAYPVDQIVLGWSDVALKMSGDIGVYEEIVGLRQGDDSRDYRVLDESDNAVILDHLLADRAQRIGEALDLDLDPFDSSITVSSEGGVDQVTATTDHHLSIPYSLRRKSDAELSLEFAGAFTLGALDAPVFLDPRAVGIWGYPDGWVYDLARRQVARHDTVVSDDPIQVRVDGPLTSDFEGPWSVGGPPAFGPFARAVWYLGDGSKFDYRNLLQLLVRARTNLGDTTLREYSTTLTKVGGVWVAGTSRRVEGMDVVSGGRLLRSKTMFPIRVVSSDTSLQFTDPLPLTGDGPHPVVFRETWLSRLYQAARDFHGSLTTLRELLGTLHPSEDRWYRGVTAEARLTGESELYQRFSEYRISDILTAPESFSDLGLLEEKLHGLLDQVKP